MSSVLPEFRKYYNTPLRDLWRLDLSSSLDWRLTIRQSELPDEIQSLIRQVVTKSRLMRIEKASVAQELIAHFEDGNRHGRSFAQLAKDFGDPVVTALLIRRSKIRNRPMMMKMIRGFGAGAALLVAIYACVTVFFYMGKPTPSVDYLVEFNRPVTETADADKAWPIYRPLWTKYGFSDGGGFDIQALHYFDDEGVYQRLIRPTDAGWQAAVEQLSEYEDLLDAFRIGSKLPSLGIELQVDPANYSDEDFAAFWPGGTKDLFTPDCGIIGWDDEMNELASGSLIGVLLPHVQGFRKAARMFCVDTRIAVEENDSDRATENIETTIGLAHHAAEGNCLVCGLVGFAISGMAMNQLEEVLEQNPEFFTGDQLARIQNRIERINFREWVHLEGERVMIHDLIQRMFSDDGNGDGRMTPNGVEMFTFVSGMTRRRGDESGIEKLIYSARPVIAPASVFLCASRKKTAETTDQLVDQLETDFDKPFWMAEHPDIDSFLRDNSIKYMLLNTVFPGFQQIRNAMDRCTGRQEGVIAALAIHRYFLKYGQWPTEYDQVAPEFVGEFPLDEVNGGLLKFKYDNESLLVYSVGNDRDDDGGQDRFRINEEMIPREFFIFAQQPVSKNIPDGDWIVWPTRSED